MTTLRAGVPYIIKWESGDNLVNPVFEGVTIDATVRNCKFDGVQFIGIQAPITFVETSHL